MSNQIDFDIQVAHEHFSRQCFNRAWDLIDKADRTPQDDEEMLRLSHASHYHWTQREDYSPKNASIAYWQIARIYALLGQADNARHYAQQCLQAGQEGQIEPFYLGYAYEALARAEAVAGDREKAEGHIQTARQVAEGISEAEDRQLLLDDLNTI